MTTAARFSNVLMGSLLLAFGYVCWLLLFDAGQQPDVSAVEWVIRVTLWIAPTVGGAALLRRRRPSAPDADERRLRRLRWAIAALAVSVVVALGYLLVARWIHEHHRTNGVYAIFLIPIGGLLWASSVGFYAAAWSTYASSRRFEAPLALLAPGGMALLTALLVALHP